jgi:hypothetical protein
VLLRTSSSKTNIVSALILSAQEVAKVVVVVVLLLLLVMTGRLHATAPRRACNIDTPEGKMRWWSSHQCILQGRERTRWLVVARDYPQHFPTQPQQLQPQT